VSARPAYRGAEFMEEYRYELRRGDEVLATGHLSSERPLEVGGRVVIGGRPGIVRSVDPVLGERELRLVVQLWREGLDE
jgi:L-arabinose isomerase